MVNTDEANLKSSVFFIWGGLCTCAFVYAYFLIPETKGLTLEQVDKMMEETTPRTSAGWKPKNTFAEELGMTSGTGGGKMNSELINDVERKGSVF